MKKIFLTTIFLFIVSVALAQSNSIIKVSGDKQLGLKGIELKEDFTIQLTDPQNTPLKNMEVEFSVIQDSLFNDAKNLSYLQKSKIKTDENGYAKTRLVIGKKSEDKIVIFVTSENAKPAYFTVSVMGKNWLLMMIAGILGGISFLLYGIFKINTSFQKIAGPNIRTILTKFTSNKYKGFLTGLTMTSLNQSSSATSLFQIGLVSAGLLSFQQSMGVTVGASVGSTITGQLVAFKLVNYALIIISFGFLLSFFAVKKRLVSVGNAIFGFGLIFFGLKLMSDAMIPVTLNSNLLEMIAGVQYPIFLLFMGIALTMMLHSSAATLGIAIVLASSGILSLLQAVCICLGAQIGTCTTDIIGSINQPRNAKRVMLWHLTFQTLGAAIILPLLFIKFDGTPIWLHFVKFVTHKIFMSNDIAREVAMSHTMVALTTASLVLPAISVFHRFILFIYPCKKCENMTEPIFIDEKYISQPNKALELSKKEIVRISEILLQTVKESLKIIETRYEDVADSIAQKAFDIRVLAAKLEPYLSKIGQNKLSTEQSKKQIALLYIVADFEQIADIIERNFMFISHEKIKRNLRFSDEGFNDIKELHSIIYANCSKTTDAFEKDDILSANEIIHTAAELHNTVHVFKKKHISRLQADLKESVETSGLHMDVLDQYTRINDILVDIASTISKQ